MAENQFSVKVPDLNQAIAGGEEAYSGVQKLMQTRQLTQAREAAAKNVMDGGDLKNSLAMLMGIGDEKGAATLATVMHNQQTGDFQNRQLGQQALQFETSSAETARAHRATEGQAAAALEETKNQHRLDLAKPFKAGEGYLGDPQFLARNPQGGYVRVKADEPPAGQVPAAPQYAPAPQPNAPLPPPGPGPSTFQDRFQPPVAPAAALQPQPTAPVDPEEQRKAALLASRPPPARGLIAGIANYEIDPRTALARLPATARANILTDVADYRPGWNQQNYPASQAAYTKFTSGKESATVRSFNVGLEHLDQLGELGKALENGDYPLLNSLRNKYKTFIGSADPTNFNGLKAIVGAEIVKAIVGAGGTGEERAAAAKTVNDASSPTQLLGIIKTYKGAMGAQLGGLKQTYETGTMRNDFEKFMSPTAIKAFKEHQSEGGGNVSAPGIPGIQAAADQGAPVKWRIIP